jgi:hypothetical protein
MLPTNERDRNNNSSTNKKVNCEYTGIVAHLQTMRVSRVLCAASKQHSLKSLALSVYFKHPDLGMQDYEILSRATAYLLNVDAKDKAEKMKEGPYEHLEAAEEWRDNREYKQTFGRSRAGGAGRKIMDVGWLEFAPREVRPRVHVVCSSHVLAPYLWKDYYPQDWLSVVRQEHCKFSLEVYDPDRSNEALATFSLNSQPYHHPEGRDIALVHFRDEVESLDTLRGLGVQTHYLRDPDNLYDKGEVMDFDGFVVDEPDAIDRTTYSQEVSNENEDTRIFRSYRETGTLSFHTEDRFFATTPKPLPQGLCGAPVTDKDGDLCGTVEGIVPIGHKNEKLAGSAAFLPSFVMKVFIDFVERSLVEQMMPNDLFQMVAAAKKTNSIGGGLFGKDKEGSYTAITNWEKEYDRTLATLKARYTTEEVDKIMDMIEDQREDVLNIFEKDGGDLDQIIERVRVKTEHIKSLVQDQFLKSKHAEISEPSNNKVVS